MCIRTSQQAIHLLISSVAGTGMPLPDPMRIDVVEATLAQTDEVPSWNITHVLKELTVPLSFRVKVDADRKRKSKKKKDSHASAALPFGLIPDVPSRRAAAKGKKRRLAIDDTSPAGEAASEAVPLEPVVAPEFPNVSSSGSESSDESSGSESDEARPVPVPDDLGPPVEPDEVDLDRKERKEKVAAGVEEVVGGIDISEDEAPPTPSAPAPPTPSGTTTTTTTTTTYFNAELGVVGVAIAASGLSKCHYCNLHIDKKSARFCLAWAAKRPTKWIHPECSSLVPHEHSLASIRCLKNRRAELVSPVGILLDENLVSAIDRGIGILSVGGGVASSSSSSTRLSTSHGRNI
jgi:hypothetical protein